MQTIVNQSGVNTVPGEVSLVVQGVLYVGEINILAKIESLQSQLAELEQIKTSLKTLQSVVDAFSAELNEGDKVVASKSGVVDDSPQASATTTSKKSSIKSQKKPTQEAA